MADIVFLKASRVHLRALQEKDLTPAYLQWLNDEDVCRNNSHAVFPNTEAKMQAYYNNLQNQQHSVVLAIIHTEHSKHIGNIALQNINWVSRNAEFAILLGEKAYWSGGYGFEAAELIVKYGFMRLNLHRIYCGTLENNEGMKKLAAKLNMVQEGVRRDAIYKDGAYRHIIEYGVLKTEFTNL